MVLRKKDKAIIGLICIVLLLVRCNNPQSRLNDKNNPQSELITSDSLNIQSNSECKDGKNKSSEEDIIIGEEWPEIKIYFEEEIDWLRSRSMFFKKALGTNSDIFVNEGGQGLDSENMISVDVIRQEKKKIWLFFHKSNGKELLTDTISISFPYDYSFSRTDTEEQINNHGKFIRYIGICMVDTIKMKFNVKRMYGITTDGKLIENNNPKIEFAFPSWYQSTDM